MPLPIFWLIAVGTVAAVGAVGAALSKGDSKPAAANTANRRSNSDEDNEDELEQREEKARNKKIDNARRNFRKEGAGLGLDIQKSIKGWIDIEFIEDPFFKLKLGKDMPTKKIAVIEKLSFFEKKSGFRTGYLQNRFEVFLSAYAAELKLGKQLVQAEKKIDGIDKDIKKIQDLKKLIVNAK